MSIAHQHNEWLSLVEVSGPFLSLPVLLRVFPQGLDAHDTEVSKNVRLAFGEWEDHHTEVAIHTAWLEFVLTRILGYPDDYLLKGQALPNGLEARVHEHGETLRPTYALKSPTEALPRMLVSVYPPSQALTKPVSDTAWKTGSPDTRMMTLLHATGVSLGLVTNGEKWILVAAKPGETTSYITWDASLWSEEPLTLRAFVSLLGVGRFFGVAENETLPNMLAESALNQQEVTDQLGQQVLKAVEVLIQALDRINVEQHGRILKGIHEKDLYQAALTVMMRLVFLLSAEERGLLLLGDALYDRHYAISMLRDQLREIPDEQLLEHRHDAWSRFLATCRVIYGGVEHEAMRLPAYGGGLFDPDRFPFLEGRESSTSWVDTPAAPLPVNNRTVLHLLESLQFLRIRVPGGGIEPRRLSFRALDIEQIGHVYEGLLDHTAERATSPVLGFRASGGDDIEISLSELDERATAGEDELIAFLKEKTGRTPAAIRRAFAQAGDTNLLMLQSACGTADGLYDRIKRYALLLREDSNGYPVVVQQGSVYVTSGSDRRSTGTHYTPRSLTEPVVKTTLEPLVYEGVDRGEAPTPERLKTPSEILSLKICDFACGSGAFLVQVCRYLSERLIEAWALAEAARPEVPLVVPEALPSGSHHSEQLLPGDFEERLALARRLVAERCVYGVDVNPMAVEMAKLSLWLVTLHKNRPFTFLDHAIKCGDSLLGLHQAEQIESFHLVPSGTIERLHDYIKSESMALLDQARSKREQLERFTVLDVHDAELKGELHSEAEVALRNVRELGDLIVGAGLYAATSTASRSLKLLDAKLDELLLDVGAVFTEKVSLPNARLQGATPLTGKAERMLNPDSAPRLRRPFHWLIEFPEVFLNTDAAGFDAIVGNPPFVGGKKITGLFGDDYRDYQVLYTAGGRKGHADLCAYFFLRASALLKPNGNFGLLAVNTIAEGDTRQVGLEAMLHNGYSIYAAVPNFDWPGAAVVVASAVYVHRGSWGGSYQLSNKPVSTISAFLSSEVEWSPMPLKANANKSFIGSYVLGTGFIVRAEEALALIADDAKNAHVLFPYLNGEDLNSELTQKASRWVINFWDWPLARDAEGMWASAPEDMKSQWLRDGHVPADYSAPVAQDYPDVLSIVEEKVKPERRRKDVDGKFVLRKPLPDRWWHYADKRPALYHAIGRGHAFFQHPDSWNSDCIRQPAVIATSLVQNFLKFAIVSNDSVFAHKLAVFPMDWGLFGALSSSFHQIWARKTSSTMRVDLNYSPTDTFETMPFPASLPSTFATLSKQFNERRAAMMVQMGVGLTRLYNLFNSADCTQDEISLLRSLHVEIDDALLAAYGWQDIDLGHGFHSVTYLPANDRVRFTICEEARLEVLRRLARLNRQRYEDEHRENLERTDSLHNVNSVGRSSKRPRVNTNDAQSQLF
ncbi:Eco57I restriction-modification methylase domain-containing protein [Burkholderia pseudomallei]|uniref:Eco57I restriction-modification methylase domain-containing protein n=1 Tax=Burkholderia pseudomallei TaxID=28450 RepID=UPI0009779838|nr:DNA methyltransferase [Burkholderia pseudomallei]CAJ2785038.1 Methylase of polypeptide chain release factors [Burkholderia pseudomallei]CAJ2818028.1 Methylase of polypeptide chain release factors [Burkholderia pseudomallei]CAJ2907225.1 Methylase of polypeptide chain release factors [Burkholderia pseudomallei]CAJ6551556.1 Methylase of polypeptide chain release factors [Burkholderia pseudomallei]CAJ6810887.1 Methylase of polypeptide chain release factors [Burkholderia pseudomallei]